MHVGSPAQPSAFGFWPKENHWGQATSLLCSIPQGSKGQNINLCSESHVNDCVCWSLFLNVLRLGASFIPCDRAKNQHGYISAADIILAMCHWTSFFQASSS